MWDFLIVVFVCDDDSVTIVLAYLMHKHGMGLIQAMDHVKNKRPAATPNIGFVQQLLKLEKARRDNNI